MPSQTGEKEKNNNRLFKFMNKITVKHLSWLQESVFIE